MRVVVGLSVSPCVLRRPHLVLRRAVLRRPAVLPEGLERRPCTRFPDFCTGEEGRFRLFVGDSGSLGGFGGSCCCFQLSSGYGCFGTKININILPKLSANPFTRNPRSSRSFCQSVTNQLPVLCRTLCFSSTCRAQVHPYTCLLDKLRTYHRTNTPSISVRSNTAPDTPDLSISIFHFSASPFSPPPPPTSLFPFTTAKQFLLCSQGISP